MNNFFICVWYRLNFDTLTHSFDTRIQKQETGVRKWIDIDEWLMTNKEAIMHCNFWESSLMFLVLLDDDNV